MDDDQMRHFVEHLGELSEMDPNVLFGNHMRRMGRDKERRHRTSPSDERLVGKQPLRNDTRQGDGYLGPSLVQTRGQLQAPCQPTLLRPHSGKHGMATSVLNILLFKGVRSKIWSSAE